MAQTEEGKIQAASIKHANSEGIRTIRFYFGPGIQTGWPDVMFLGYGGKILFIEFKAPGKLPTPKQEIKIKLLRELGFEVAVCDSVDKAKKAISGVFFRGKTNLLGLIR